MLPLLFLRIPLIDNCRTNEPSPSLGTIRAEGIIRNVNTLEDFKNMDKAAMIKTAGRQVLDHSCS